MAVNELEEVEEREFSQEEIRDAVILANGSGDVAGLVEDLAPWVAAVDASAVEERVFELDPATMDSLARKNPLEDGAPFFVSDTHGVNNISDLLWGADASVHWGG